MAQFKSNSKRRSATKPSKLQIEMLEAKEMLASDLYGVAAIAAPAAQDTGLVAGMPDPGQVVKSIQQDTSDQTEFHYLASGRPIALDPVENAFTIGVFEGVDVNLSSYFDNATATNPAWTGTPKMIGQRIMSLEGISEDWLNGQIDVIANDHGVSPDSFWTAPVFTNGDSGLKQWTTDEVVIQLDGVQAETFFSQDLFSSYRPLRGTPDQFVATLARAGGIEALELTNHVLPGLPGVVDASMDFHSEIRYNYVPNDPNYPSQWHLHNTGQTGGVSDADADLQEAWDDADGGEVVIAIHDDGVDLSHPDLNLWSNPSEIAGNDIDDDGNGWIDDRFGINLTDGPGSSDDVLSNDPSPMNASDNHGTSVAGIAAARTNNSLGVAGAGRNAQIMAIAACQDSCTASQMAESVYYSAGRTADGMGTWRGADISNHSYTYPESTTFTDAFNWATSNGRNGLGTPAFASTGNDADDWTQYSITGISIPFNLFDEGAQVRISYVKDGSLSNGDDSLWLANMRLPDGSTQRFDTFGNFQGWTSGGDALGVMVDDPSHQHGTGRYALRAGAGDITHNQRTDWYSPEFESDGTFRFHYWVSSESSFDGMEIAIRYRTGVFGEWGGWNSVGSLVSGVPSVTSAVGYPSRIASVISVGASTDFDYRSGYSQYGPELDFVAPSSGGNAGTYTTDRIGAPGYNGTDYEPSFGGTSSASPLAAGVGALLISDNPEITAAQLRTALQNSADQEGNVTYTGGVNTFYGHGRLDADNALIISGEDANDQISEASSIGYDSTTSGRVGSSTDVDMYAISVSAGDVLGFDLDNFVGDTSDLDTYLRLFDSSGNQVTASDDNTGPEPEVRPTRESYIPYTFTSSGTYYLGVSAYNNSSYNANDGTGDSGASSSGNYQLIVHDANDQISESTSIAVGSSGTGHIGFDSDVALFSFSATSGQTLGFDIDNVAGGTLDSRIRIFDGSGNELVENDDRPGPAPEEYFREGYTEYTFDTAGTYYAGVSYYQNDAYNIMDGTGDYDGFASTGGFSLHINDLSPTGPILVTSASDAGDGIVFDGNITLREAIMLANSPGADIINFDTSGTFSTPQTINLNGDQFQISESLTVNGPGADQLTIDAGGQSRIFNFDGPGTNSSVLNDLTVANGSEGFGAGVRVGGDDTLTINRTVFRDHIATGNGGAFEIVFGATLNVNDSTIHDNQANVGAAINVFEANLTVANSTFSNNASRGIQVWGTAASTAEVDQSTLVDTRLEVISPSTVEYSNTIFDSAGANISGTGTITSLGYNLSEDATGDLSGPGDVGSTDPMLGLLADNGGSTPTHALLEGSPAINRGNPAVTGGTDQTGAPRVVGGVMDSGAVEADPPVVRTLGSLPSGMSTQPGYDLRSGEVGFYRFDLAADVLSANGDGLVIDTEGTVLGDGSIFENDTELGLYDASGNQIANDDDGGTDRLSRLGFGTAGFDGDLVAGTYYVSVSGFDTSFGATDFDVTSTSAFAGNLVVNFNLTSPPAVACDFDGDLDCDINDLDMLYPELGGSNPVYNLDGLGIVDNDDVTEWLSQASAADPLGRTFVRGDANLDGDVGGSDFTALASGFGLPGGWSNGNFVVDAIPGGGTVGGSDFTALAASFGFMSTQSLTASGTAGNAGQPAELRTMDLDQDNDKEDDQFESAVDQLFEVWS